MNGDQGSGARFYYGWVIVAAGCLIWAVAFGIQYSFGIFFKPLQEAFGWSRATTSWAMTVHLVLFALFTVPAGIAIDRYNPRLVFAIAAALIGLALALSSRISEAWQLYVLYGLPLGMGAAICGPAIMAMVTRWFPRKRGLPLGITSAGTGVGVLLGAPLTNQLIAAYGWREAFVILGAGGAALLLVCAYFIRMSPGSRDGQRSQLRAASAVGPEVPIRAAKPVSVRQALARKELFLIAAAHGVGGFALRAITVHIVPHATDIGVSSTAAALAVGTIGGVSIAGRLIMGAFQDKIGARVSMMICLGIQALAVLALPFIRTDLAFFAFAVVFGFTYGGDSPQVPALAAQAFGVASIGTVIGLVIMLATLTGAAGPVVAGYTFDTTGHYTAAFLLAGVALFAGVFSLWRLRLPDDKHGGSGKPGEEVRQ